MSYQTVDMIQTTHHKTRQLFHLPLFAAKAEEMVISSFEASGAVRKVADTFAAEIATAWRAFDLQA
jgi:hypothetical protein